MVTGPVGGIGLPAQPYVETPMDQNNVSESVTPLKRVGLPSVLIKEKLQKKGMDVNKMIAQKVSAGITKI